MLTHARRAPFKSGQVLGRVGIVGIAGAILDKLAVRRTPLGPPCRIDPRPSPFAGEILNGDPIG